MSRSLWTGALLAAWLLLTSAHGQVVHVVAGDGSGDFTRPQDAVDAADDGDLVLIRTQADAYDGLSIVGKGLTVLSDDRIRPRLADVHVTGVPAGSVVTLRFLDLRGATSISGGTLDAAQTEAGLTIDSCHGIVWVEDVHAAGADGVGSRTLADAPARDGITVTSSRAVILTRCQGAGGAGADGYESVSGYVSGGLGAEGLTVRDAQVAVYDARFLGGRGGSPVSLLTHGGRGGDAVVSTTSSLLVSGSELTGGDSGDLPVAEGASGLRAFHGGQVRHLDTSFTPGAGGTSPGLPLSAAPNVVVEGLMDDARGLTTQAPLLEQSSGRFLYRGAWGDLVTVNSSTTPAFDPSTELKGALHLAVPLSDSMFLGAVIHQEGLLFQPLAAPLLPPGIEFAAGFSQPVVGLGDGSVRVGAPSSILFLDSAFFQPLDPTLQLNDARLAAIGGAAGDGFGHAVAMDGDVAVVGAPSSDQRAPNGGAAWVFERHGTGWKRIELAVDELDAGDLLGYAVAVSGDTIVVGARGDDDGGGFAGAAYVFGRSGASWSRVDKLIAPDARPLDGFGVAVGLAGDTLAVGASFADADGLDDSGVVHVWARGPGGDWQHETRLTPHDATRGATFGHSLDADGQALVVGAPALGFLPSAKEAAYVFGRGPSGWQQLTRLEDADPGLADGFGEAVAISRGTVVVGSPRRDLGAVDAGAAHVFERSGGAWILQDVLAAAEPSAGDDFGCSVAVEDDWIVVGASRDDLPIAYDTGLAHSFLRSGSRWTSRGRLTAANAHTDDAFGAAAALSQGKTLVGATAANGLDEHTGAAYVFELP